MFEREGGAGRGGVQMRECVGVRLDEQDSASGAICFSLAFVVSLLFRLCFWFDILFTLPS